MEVTKEDLRQRYVAISDEELIALHLSSELTETASSVLRDVLSARGITDETVRLYADGNDVDKDGSLQYFQLAEPKKVKNALSKWVTAFLVSIASGVVSSFLFDGKTVGAIVSGSFLAVMFIWPGLPNEKK